MNNFFIIDGNSIMNRAFYGLGNTKMFSSIEKIHTNAIYGFLNIYWMMLDKISPDYIAVTFDLHAPTFRHEMYSEYKGTRKGMPDELREQMPYIKELLRAMNIPIIELEGYEADDILGTVARINEQNNIFTYILTGDKDSFQLISEKTSVVIPITKMGKTEYTTYTPEVLLEKLNIKPFQVIHIKALMGDTSDNIPGVKGIGEKTAYALIDKYETLDNIYENIDNLDASDKIKEKLVLDKDMAYTSKTLATIEINVPIDLDYEGCKKSDIDKEKVFNLFKRLEFNKFLSKYDFSDIADTFDSSKYINNNDASSSNVMKISLDDIKIEYINDNNFNKNINDLESILNTDKVSYILNLTEKDGFVKQDFIKSKNIFAIYNNTDTIYVFDINNLNKESLIEILNIFSRANCTKLGFNIKQDILYFFYNKVSNLINFNYDLMIADYLMNSNKSTYKIDDTLEELFNEKFILDDKEKNEKQLSLFDNQDETISDTNKLLTEVEEKNLALYLKSIYLSHDVIIKNLKVLGMLDLFNNIEMPLVETLAYMEYAGMYIDIDNLNKFDEEITANIKILEEEIYKIADEVFNINSTQQLSRILFQKLNLPTVKKNKTGFSTNKDVLEELEGKHPIISNILEYRQIMKLKTTYVDGLRGKIAEDGRIHTTFMQTVASTGRLSSVEPNLQNIPVRLELGKKIRSFFVAENSNVIIDADYSQIELRVLASISEDTTMIDAFNNNIDIHKVTASQVFNVPLEEVTPTMRSNAKAVNFGIVYGISEFGLAKNISITRSEAGTYINNYLTKYNGIKRFMDEIVENAKENGFVSTIFGRRRYIPELKQKNKNIIQFGERIAMNTPIQGTAADIIKLAMNTIYLKFKKNNLKSKLIMQVHDELIVEASKDEIEIVKEIMKESMEQVVKLKVPLDIDMNIGKSWYEAK